ncbi:MAG: hypothetical protein LBT16_09700 [Treponema sp.]|jgi:hypothetical protein|nr:hypothetical protein [Treponema sp.]
MKFNLLARVLTPAALLVALCACTTGNSVQQVLGLSAETPVFLSCKAVSSRAIAFRFSLPVTVASLLFDPPSAVNSIEEGALVTVTLAEPLVGGEQVIADLLVEDEAGNTLNVLVPFRSRNEDMPSLLITEIRTEYSKPKVEFVEFKALDAGNLGGLRMYLAETGPDAPFYEFPPAMVAQGEYIVVHLRNLDGLGVDELGGNLAASPYTKDNEAQTEARDFWFPEAKKHLTKKAGTVYFLDQDDQVLDALIWSENPDAWWGDEKLARMAEFLSGKNAWTASGGGIPGPAEAVSSGYTTTTRTICRREGAEDTNSAGDWYTTAASCATPGKINNTKVYEPK